MPQVFAIHDPNQSIEHSIVLPPDTREKTFDEFMEWCTPYYGERCVELYQKNLAPVLSPLKQFRLGVSFDNIQCKSSLVLIGKYDGSPACVRPDIKTKLVEKGWIDYTDYQSHITKEVGYIGLYLLLPHANSDIVISIEGRQDFVKQIVDLYNIEIISSKTSDGLFSSNYGQITKENLQRFFDENPMNHFLKRGLSISSVGGFSDYSGTYGPFNNFLTEEEQKKIGRFLEEYEERRMKMEHVEWGEIVQQLASLNQTLINIGPTDNDVLPRADLLQQPLIIEKLNESQITGQKITFVVKFNGTRHGCPSYPSLWIEDSNHQKVWQSAQIVELCDPDMNPMHFEHKWKIGNSPLGTPIINSTGNYTLFAEFEHNIVQKDFFVIF